MLFMNLKYFYPYVLNCQLPHFLVITPSEVKSLSNLKIYNVEISHKYKHSVLGKNLEEKLSFSVEINSGLILLLLLFFFSMDEVSHEHRKYKRAEPENFNRCK